MTTNPTTPEDDDPPCSNCGHAESDHNSKVGCTGPGNGTNGSACRCNFG